MLKKMRGKVDGLRMDQQNPKSPDRRRLSRFFLSPKTQLRYGTWFWATAMSILTIWCGTGIYFMWTILTFDPNLAKKMSVVEYLAANFKQNQWLIAGAFVLSSVLFVALAVVLTERIVGPLRALLRHIDALDKGNYEFKTVLRKSDELKPLMEALNGLSDTLKARHGSSTPEELPKTGS